MSESITRVGTEMQSYYSRPIVKEPVWQPEIPTYFFTGGIAGGCSLLHGYARVAGYERLAKTALYVGAAADVVASSSGRQRTSASNAASIAGRAAAVTGSCG